MKSRIDPTENLVSVWRTSNRITIYLIENLSLELLQASIPGAPRRTVQMIAGHIHNARCMWIKTLGKEHGIKVPDSVDRRRVGLKQLIRALNQSGRGIASLLELGYGRTLAMVQVRKGSSSKVSVMVQGGHF
jgi:hypothetical protein